MTTAFRKTLRQYSERIKVWTFLFCLVLVGLGVGYTACNIISMQESSARYAAYDRQIARKDTEIDEERRINRQTLANLTKEQAMIGRLTGRNAETLADLLDIARAAVSTAKSAATTAKSAATTAKGAARNAAKSQIRERVVQPSPAPRKKEPERRIEP